MNVVEFQTRPIELPEHAASALCPKIQGQKLHVSHQSRLLHFVSQLIRSLPSPLPSSPSSALPSALSPLPAV